VFDELDVKLAVYSKEKKTKPQKSKLNRNAHTEDSQKK